MALSAGAAFGCRSYGAHQCFAGESYKDCAPTKLAGDTQKMWVMLRACHELSEAVEVQLLQSWALFFSMTQGSSFLATLGYNI